MTIRIATRKSDLALWQAHWTQARLTELGYESELILVETQGDKDQRAFAQLSGQGFFTKAVQDALIQDRADMAVHSFKDLPSAPHPLLEIAAVSERADPRDTLLVRPECVQAEGLLPLKPQVRVGTSAVRRQRQLQAWRPDLKVMPLRGNVPTRIQKLREGHYDAIVLAQAGLTRLALDISDLHVLPLEPHVMMPAPAQGVLALECHRDNQDLARILNDLNSMESYRCIAAERGLMAMLQGGCQLALGAYAVHDLSRGVTTLQAWFDRQHVETAHTSSEAAAMLAYQALGMPAHQSAS